MTIFAVFKNLDFCFVPVVPRLFHFRRNVRNKNRNSVEHSGTERNRAEHGKSEKSKNPQNLSVPQHRIYIYTGWCGTDSDGSTCDGLISLASGGLL